MFLAHLHTVASFSADQFNPFREDQFKDHVYTGSIPSLPGRMFLDHVPVVLEQRVAAARAEVRFESAIPGRAIPARPLGSHPSPMLAGIPSHGGLTRCASKIPA
jgi:hypothetical protein